jgi:hypothetical protein
MMRIASLLLPAAVVALPVAREQALQQQAPFATIPLVTFDVRLPTPFLRLHSFWGSRAPLPLTACCSRRCAGQ